MSDSNDQNKKHPEPELTRKKHIPLKEYGLLKSMEWPDGTVITINTKKGEENLRIHHSSGVYHEFTSEGTQVSFKSNNEVNYSKGGMTVTMDNNSDGKGSGHMRVSFDHDAHVEFKKNASIVVGSKANIAGLGDLKIAAKGNLYLGAAQGKVVINGGKGVEMKGEEGRVMIEAAKGVLYLHSKEGDVHSEAKENIVMSSGQSNITRANKNITEDAKGDIGVKSGGEHSMKSEGETHVEAGGTLHLKGSDSVKIGGGGQVEVSSGVNLVSPPWITGGSAPDSAPEVQG